MFLHHSYVGPGHVLLGIVRDGEGVGADVLRSFRVSLEGIRDNLRHGDGPTAGAPGLQPQPIEERGCGNFFSFLRWKLRSLVER